MDVVADWTEVGARLREARLAAALTQAELAQRVGFERSVVAKIEAGDRRLDALELRDLSRALGLPLPHLVTRPPAAMVSRRAALTEQPDSASRSRFQLDALLQQHARDVEWLATRGHLASGGRPQRHGAASPEEARQVARAVREALGIGQDPLGPVADVCEQLALYLLVVDLDADGASLQHEAYGVAVIGGQAKPGRRRATAAHELGHHVLGDEYSSDVGVASSRDEREQVVDAFAAEFLLPGEVVRAHAQGREGDALRDALVGLAGTWRVSWSLVVMTAVRLLDVSSSERGRLLAADPMRAEFLAVLGTEPAEDLTPGTTGPAWRRGVLAALRAREITATRASELLHGSASEVELQEHAEVAGW